MTPYSLLCAHLRKTPDQVPPGALLTDVVPDSFALVELFIGLQEDLGVRLVKEDLANVRTIGELVELLETRRGGKQ